MLGRAQDIVESIAVPAGRPSKGARNRGKGHRGELINQLASGKEKCLTTARRPSVIWRFCISRFYGILGRKKLPNNRRLKRKSSYILLHYVEDCFFLLFDSIVLLISGKILSINVSVLFIFSIIFIESDIHKKKKKTVCDNEKKTHSSEITISGKEQIWDLSRDYQVQRIEQRDVSMLLLGRITMYNAKDARVTRVEKKSKY